MRAAAAVALLVAGSGCTAIVSLDEYDRGASSSSSSGSGAAGGSGAGGSGAAGGAGGAGGGGSGAACGELLHPAAGSLVDDFSDGVPGPGWTNPPSRCPPQEIDGQLVFTPPSSPDMGFCFRATVQAYHLSCSQIAFRLDEATSNDQGVQTLVYLDTLDGTQRLQLLKDIAGYNFAKAGGPSIPVSGSYDPIADRWWRLRHDGETLFFETAPDGEQWTVRSSEVSPMPLDSVIVWLGAGTYQVMDTPGSARFACYNIPAADCP